MEFEAEAEVEVEVGGSWERKDVDSRRLSWERWMRERACAYCFTAAYERER